MEYTVTLAAVIGILLVIVVYLILKYSKDRPEVRNVEEQDIIIDERPSGLTVVDGFRFGVGFTLGIWFISLIPFVFTVIFFSSAINKLFP